MARYIDADYMKKIVDMHGTNKYGMLDENIRVFIDQMPTADVRENVRGEWFDHCDDNDFIDGIECSNCGHTWSLISDKSNFCPNCGADMRGDHAD